MAVAMIYPQTNQGKATSETNSEVSRRYISNARTVLEHAPDSPQRDLASAGTRESPGRRSQRADLWRARLAMKTLRLDQRQAIAEAAED